MNHSWTVSRRCVWLAVALAAGCGDDYGGNVNANQNGNGALPVCGNGVLETGETCDDGAANSDVDPDACRTDCRPAYCGDGVVDTGEACDEGEANSDRIAGACRRSCAPASCGDGVVDPGEGCDDGNAVSEDGCAWTCEVLPGFACEGQPSVCACQPYWHHDTSGAATNLCGDCRVHVVTEWDGVDPATQDGRTWETALSDLQAAIDLAADLAAARLGVVYCSVWVKMGPYYLPPMGRSSRSSSGTASRSWGGSRGPRRPSRNAPGSARP